MTGFGAASVEQDGVALRVEVRTVNHKHLQVKVRLPSDLAFVEPALDTLVRKSLDRGAVSLTVHRAVGASPALIRVNKDVAARYRKLLGDLARELDIENDLGLQALTALPGVVGGDASDKELQREGKLAERCTRAALAELSKMRATEGGAMLKELLKHHAAIGRIVARVEKRMPKVVRAHREQLVERVRELVDDTARVQEADLAREIAVLADRLDVTEEIARLASHLDQMESLFEKSGPVGRQLDFLVQEVFREANTVASKCNDAQVAHMAVELKTVIERLREQVQNIE